MMYRSVLELPTCRGVDLSLLTPVVFERQRVSIYDEDLSQVPWIHAAHSMLHSTWQDTSVPYPVAKSFHSKIDDFKFNSAVFCCACGCISTMISANDSHP